jgi:hypothetical protein
MHSHHSFVALAGLIVGVAAFVLQWMSYRRGN